MKWLVFPEQKISHLKSISGEIVDRDKIVLSDQSFWKDHRESLGLSVHSSMILNRKWSIPGTHYSYERYDQYVHGIRVFGGEYQVVVGNLGGVLHAHGLPMIPTKSKDEYHLDLIHNKINEVQILNSIENYCMKRFKKDVKLVVSSPIEHVWHMSLVTVAKQGLEKVAYYVNGRSESMPFIAFDAFVDIKTGEVLEFIDKSGEITEQRELHIEVSPFESPLTDTNLYVYDQYLKDFNDDKNDYYYYQDPDRYSNYTMVWNSVDSQYSYPTTDEELNYLVDNTLYIKYMYYSLSGGQYVTWNETQTDLNIEYNLTIANAFFDGVWGIHFGTGYITDDVVSHEWSHG
jgi:hypothetical protein